MESTFVVGGGTGIVKVSIGMIGDEKCGSFSPNTVGIQVLKRELSGETSAVMSAHLKPSEARALASAILSAATEARE